MCWNLTDIGEGVRAAGSLCPLLYHLHNTCVIFEPVAVVAPPGWFYPCSETCPLLQKLCLHDPVCSTDSTAGVCHGHNAGCLLASSNEGFKRCHSSFTEFFLNLNCPALCLPVWNSAQILDGLGRTHESFNYLLWARPMMSTGWTILCRQLWLQTQLEPNPVIPLV